MAVGQWSLRAVQLAQQGRFSRATSPVQLRQPGGLAVRVSIGSGFHRVVRIGAIRESRDARENSGLVNGVKLPSTPNPAPMDTSRPGKQGAYGKGAGGVARVEVARREFLSGRSWV